MGKNTNLKNDYCYNKYDSYEHIYCRVCKHSVFFKSNYPAVCSYCGAMIYPSKKSEFKSKLERELRKNKYKEKINEKI